MLPSRCYTASVSGVLQTAGFLSLASSSTRCRPVTLTRRSAWGLSDGPRQSNKPAKWEAPTRKDDIARTLSRTAIKPRKPPEFYDWFLYKTLIDHTRGIAVPGAWINSLDVDSLLRCLPEHLHGAPLSVFTTPKCSVNTLQKCLEVFISNIHASTQGSHDLLNRYSEARPGTRALHRMLQDFEDIDMNRCGDLLRIVAHCLVAEGRGDVIDKWRNLRISPKPHHAIDNDNCGHPKWKAFLLRDYMEAKSYWSPGGLNSALGTFFETPEMDRNSGACSAAPTAIWIWRQIWIHGSRGIEETLYNRFQSWFSVYVKDHGDRKYNAAKFHMRHPVQPDAMPALRFLRDASTNPDQSVFIQDLLNPKDGRAASTLFWFVIDAAQQLNDQGLIKEAHEILDIGAAAIPKYFVPGQRGNAYASLKAQEPRGHAMRSNRKA